MAARKPTKPKTITLAPKGKEKPKAKAKAAPAAPAKPQRSPVIRPAAKSATEARQILKGDLERRLADADRILSAEDTAGYYDTMRQLFTTVDGQPRPVTVDDLALFRKKVDEIKKRHGAKEYRGGIRPKQVIDLSHSSDRARANQQIHTVIPVTHRGGLVHFQTNSGPDSNTSRHHVMVQFLDFDRAMADPTVETVAYRIMVGGNVRFDCTCGRHTFWYRYIATIGNYNHGRPEDGFPKIRNPNLKGVACKHVIKVMGVIAQSPTFAAYAQRMIRTGRQTLNKKPASTTVKAQQEFIEQMAKERSRQRKILTTEEKRLARQNQPAEKRKAAARAALKKAEQATRQRYAAKVNRPVAEADQVRLMMNAMGFTEAQARAALRAAKDVQG